NRYQLMREMFPTETTALGTVDHPAAKERLHTVVIPEDSWAVGRTIGELNLPCREIQAWVHQGMRHAHPAPDERLSAGDALILFGANQELKRSETALCNRSRPASTG